MHTNERGLFMIKYLKEYSVIVAGSMLLAFAASAFIIPMNLGSGGVTGIALGLNNIFGFKVGLVSLLINIPLFIFGFNLLGKKFVIKSGVSVIVSSLMLDFFNANFHFSSINDSLLGSIFCGLLIGISLSIIFMYGGSTGGLDILAKIINNKFKSIPLSKILLILDILVYLFIGAVLGPKAVMYAIVISFIRSNTMDAMQEGILASRQCIIICDNADNLVKEINSKLERGVTVLDATGGYSNSNKKLIYLVIQKTQLNSLRTLITEVDPSAFISVSPVNEILGNYRSGSSFF